MRRSTFFVKTRREAPADETSRNAQLLIRAGFIHKEMAGVYSYLPMGKMVLEKISRIVREEMNALGASEIQMSTLQNKELWEKTGRWDDKTVDNWFKSKLANGADVGIGLTHEEPVISALKPFISSYKDLPVYSYQIQTKFRNELRAKSGLMRGREFLMKDLYSFSRTQAEHDEFYNRKIVDSYFKVYERLGLGGITYKTVASGGYFSKFSHEFQTLSDVGEDIIYVSESKKIAVNKEVYTEEVLAELGLSKDELVEKKAVEVGNIFPLGTKYSDSLELFYVDQKGQKQSVIMGSYGIGVSRLMGLLAEHFADDKGLVWPKSVSPFLVYLVRLGADLEVSARADDVYNRLTEAGIGVIYDDREASAGEMFADADLMGLPARVVVSPKTVEAGACELKLRAHNETQSYPLDKLVEALANHI